MTSLWLQLEEMLTREGCTLASLAPHPLDTIVPGGRQQVLANTGSASGGYADQVFRWVERLVFMAILQ